MRRKPEPNNYWSDARQLRVALSLLVLATLIRQAFLHNYEGVFMCVLTLMLFGVPNFIERRTGIDLPTMLEGIINAQNYQIQLLPDARTQC